MNHYHHGLFVNRRRLREVAQAAMTSINVTLPLDTLVSELSIARCQLGRGDLPCTGAGRTVDCDG